MPTKKTLTLFTLLPLVSSGFARPEFPARIPQTGFVLKDAFPELSFEDFGEYRFTDIVRYPGTTDLILVARSGRLYRVNTEGAPEVTPFIDLSDRVHDDWELGMYAIAFHPDFANNHYFYVHYSTVEGEQNYSVIRRYEMDPDSPSAGDPDSEFTILKQTDDIPMHQGGALRFGPDDYLYFAVGDGGEWSTSTQTLGEGFFGGIFRIDVDGRPLSLQPNPHPDSPGNYWIPSDNPFVGATSYYGQTYEPDEVRTEYYALGLRNPWGMEFDSETGELWIGEVGELAFEEIDKIEPGKNYGWPLYEGFLFMDGWKGLFPWIDNLEMEPPVYVMGRKQYSFLSITGGYVYHGDALPGIKDTYLFGVFGPNAVYSLKEMENGPAEVKELATTNDAPIAFGKDPSNGDPLVSLLDSPLKRLVYVTNDEGAEAPPENLSETGIFSNLQALEPADGVVGYEVNQPFWSDYAQKRRWFSLPDGTQATAHPEEAWESPEGTVFIKHFSMERVRGRPQSRFPVETRVLVHGSEGYYGLSYRWNEEGTDATLVPPEGMEETFQIETPDGSVQQTYIIPSRSQCLQCHTSNNGAPLSFNTRQLQRTVLNPDGQPVSQIQHLSESGYVDSSQLNTDSPIAAVAGIDDVDATPYYRLKSYWAVNCMQCHSPSGTVSDGWNASWSTPLRDKDVMMGELLNPHDTQHTHVLVPGEPEASEMVRRLETMEAGHMPPLATSVINRQGLNVLLEFLATNKSENDVLISHNVLYAPAKGGEAALQIEAPDDIVWSATNDAEWVASPQPGTSSGDGWVRMNASTNTSPTNRKTTVEISPGGMVELRQLSMTPIENTFPGAVELDHGWVELPALGSAYAWDWPWIYLPNHEWLYAEENTSYLWDEHYGWLWTNQEIYPNVYQFSEQRWLSYAPETGYPRWFYDYETQSWIKD